MVKKYNANNILKNIEHHEHDWFMQSLDDWTIQEFKSALKSRKDISCFWKLNKEDCIKVLSYMDYDDYCAEQLAAYNFAMR